MADHHREDEVFGGPFSEPERKAIRRVIRKIDRTNWLWRLIRIWFGYIVATTTAVYTGWDHLMRMFHFLLDRSLPPHP